MSHDLELQIKEMLVETLMLQVEPGEIGDADVLWGDEGLGLDSVDALQIVVSLDKKFGLKITDQEAAKQALVSVSTIAGAVRAAGS